LDLVAALSSATTLIVGLLVGRRLLLLARSTRRTPELFFGAGSILLVVAATLEVGAFELARAAHPWAYRVEVLALLTHSASASCISFSVWRLFYPNDAWALRVCLLQTALLFTSWQAVILPGQHTWVTGFTPWFHLHVASRGLAFAWAAVAAGAHYLRLRRQRALGLADAFLCHRFLLWTISMTASALIFVTAVATNVIRGELIYSYLPAELAVSMLGLVSGWALLFAFLPPAAYVRWIESLHAPDGAVAPAR